jgi:hypothetical protein
VRVAFSTIGIVAHVRMIGRTELSVGVPTYGRYKLVVGPYMKHITQRKRPPPQMVLFLAQFHGAVRRSQVHLGWCYKNDGERVGFFQTTRLGVSHCFSAVRGLYLSMMAW